MLNTISVAATKLGVDRLQQLLRRAQEEPMGVNRPQSVAPRRR